MKTTNMFFSVPILLLCTVSSAIAQSDKTQRAIGIKTQTIKVSGTCSMDKRRIETSAYSIDGVKSATWEQGTQILKVTYSAFKKEAADNVQKRVAAAGNDTEKYRADDIVYQKLPDCCHYQRKQL